jgi:hypothetical protein
MTGLVVSPWAWAVAAVVIAFCELPVPGSYLIWIACAAALTALMGFLIDWPLTSQLSFFVIACIGTCVAGYFVYRHFDRRGRDGEPMNRRDIDMIGQSAIASEAFVNGHGRIRLNDTVWLAQGEGDIAAGTPVVVTGLHGTSLMVRPK